MRLACAVAALGMPALLATQLAACPLVQPAVCVSSGSTAADIIVQLPADAKLLIDDHPTTSTGGRREFRTPPLQAGREYGYVLTVQAQREGRLVAVSRRITVRAGHTTEVDLRDLTAAAPPPEPLSPGGFRLPHVDELPELNLPKWIELKRPRT
jgi:uncharacterized protein (TIGR03000 family)